MRIVVLLAVLASADAAAQPACDPCVRGDALIDRFGIGEVRPIAPQLANLALAEPLSSAQYETIVAMRNRTPALGKLGALDDTDLALVAAALCRAPDNDCTQHTARALTCLADRCEVSLPNTSNDPRHIDALFNPLACRSRAKHPGTPVGLGFDWGNGYQRSGAPNDGRSWSFGIEGRWRISRRLGAVARVDRTIGRDELVDTDGDGRDDMATGSIARVDAFVGPSFVLDSKRYERTTRFLRLDLLAGYLTTRSQPGEDGPAVGADLGYQISIVRIGMRFVQGFAGAGDATMLLAHMGIAVGSVPPHDDDDDCRAGRHQSETDTRLALAFEAGLGGGFDPQLGFSSGFALQTLWYLTRRLDAAARADLSIFPNGGGDRVIHSALLAGGRLDLGKRGWRRQRTGWFTTAMFGYSHSAGFAMTDAGSGPVIDIGLGWGIQDREAAGYFKLGTRFGLADDNREYRAILISGGLELRLDSRRWRDRIRR